jgi:septum formation protein
MLQQNFNLLLASQSPRRAELLKQIGVDFTLLPPQDSASAAELEILETPLANEAAENYVVRVAENKLRYHLGALRPPAFPQKERTLENTESLPNPPPSRYDELQSETWVLCADTTVSLDGAILGKPENAEDAKRMLSALSGREHHVFTSVFLASASALEEKDAPIFHALSRSQVRFSPLSKSQIQNYIDSAEPFGKAGSYAIQGRAGVFVEHLSGSYTGIMGLPLFETAHLLRQAGWRG